MDVDEGRLADDFSGRQWGVSIRTASEARSEDARADQDAKSQKEQKQLRDDGSKILAALDRLANEDGVASYNKVRDAAGLSGPRMTRGVLALVEEGVVSEGKMVVTIGSNAKRQVAGLQRVKATALTRDSA